MCLDSLLHKWFLNWSKSKKGTSDRFENFVQKSGQNVLFLANISKFHKIVLFYTEKGYFGPKKRVGTGNGLFYYIYNKKGKRGTIFLNFCEILDFEIFRRFLTKIQIYPFWYPFYPFFGGGKKVLHFCHILHKYL